MVNPSLVLGLKPVAGGNLSRSLTVDSDNLFKKTKNKSAEPGLVTHALNPSTQEAKLWISLRVQGQRLVYKVPGHSGPC